MPWMRTLAAPSDGDVVCTRMPPISFSIMTMSPGVMSIFSSISSRSRASTRIGWSSMRRPVRVVATTVTSSSRVSSGSRATRTTRSSPAATVTGTVTGTNPSRTTVTCTSPAGAGTSATPAASVACVVPATTTAAPATASAPVRTSTRTRPGAWPAAPAGAAAMRTSRMRRTRFDMALDARGAGRLVNRPRRHQRPMPGYRPSAILRGIPLEAPGAPGAPTSPRDISSLDSPEEQP